MGERKYKPWENNKHTITILKHLLFPHQVYWCEKCQKHVPARRSPGEIYALRRAIRKLGGRLTRMEQAHTEKETWRDI